MIQRTVLVITEKVPLGKEHFIAHYENADRRGDKSGQEHSIDMTSAYNIEGPNAYETDWGHIDLIDGGSGAATEIHDSCSDDSPCKKGAMWRSEISDGERYQIYENYIKASTEFPISFFDNEHKLYLERRAYNETHGIIEEATLYTCDEHWNILGELNG